MESNSEHLNSDSTNNHPRSEKIYSDAEVKELVTNRKNSILKVSNANSSKTTNELKLESSQGVKEWGEIKPIIPITKGEPYPVKSLPDILRKAVEEVQSYVQAPFPLIVNSALSCLSTACQTHFNVQRDNQLIGPISLYFLTIAESGERKTTCDSFFSKELINFQLASQEKMQSEINSYQADLKKWEAQSEGVQAALKNISKGNKVGILKTEVQLTEELNKLHQNKPIRPFVPCIIRSDDTPENLAHALMHEWPSAGIISSEGGLIFASRALNKDNKMSTLTMYNTFWDGGLWHIGRKTSESFTVNGARLSIGIQVQPQVFEKFNLDGDNLSRNIGFIARCLFSNPDSTQGSRLYKPCPEEMLNLKTYNSHVRKILEKEPKFINGKLQFETIKLHEDARKIWREFHDHCELNLGFGQKYENLRDIASKIADNATRIAANLVCLKGSLFLEIDADTMERACQIAQWHLDESNRQFGNTTEKTRQKLHYAKILEDWLIKKARENSCNVITKNKCEQYGPNQIKRVEVLNPTLKLLEERNRCRIINGGRQIELNPDLLKTAIADLSI